MERFNALSRGTQLMLAGAALLLVDTFLPWQEVSVEALGVSISESWTAWHGFWGVLLGLLTIVLLGWLVLRLLGTEVALPVSDTLVGAVLAGLILLCALLKILTDEAVAWGAWLGLALATAIAVGAWLRVQEAGGVDALRGDLTATDGGGAAAQTPNAPMTEPAPRAAPVTPPTPPPAEPDAPAPPPEPVAPAEEAGAPAATEEPPAPAPPTPPPPPDATPPDEPRG